MSPKPKSSFHQFKKDKRKEKGRVTFSNETTTTSRDAPPNAPRFPPSPLDEEKIASNRLEAKKRGELMEKFLDKNPDDFNSISRATNLAYEPRASYAKKQWEDIKPDKERYKTRHLRNEGPQPLSRADADYNTNYENWQKMYGLNEDEEEKEEEAAAASRPMSARAAAAAAKTAEPEPLALKSSHRNALQRQQQRRKERRENSSTPPDRPHTRCACCHAGFRFCTCTHCGLCGKAIGNLKGAACIIRGECPAARHHCRYCGRPICGNNMGTDGGRFDKICRIGNLKGYSNVCIKFPYGPDGVSCSAAKVGASPDHISNLKAAYEGFISDNPGILETDYGSRGNQYENDRGGEGGGKRTRRRKRRKRRKKRKTRRKKRKTRRKKRRRKKRRTRRRRR